MYENKAVKRIFGPKREEVTGGCRQLQNEELQDLYYSENVIRIIKSRRMKLAGNAARMAAMRNVYRILVRKSDEQN
jgi:hypothetical protein